MKRPKMKKWSVDVMRKDERGNPVQVTCIVYALSSGQACGKVMRAGYVSIDGEFALFEMPL